MLGLGLALGMVCPQADIETKIDEKNRLLQDVLDAERAILQWEKKIQLAEEIREAIVDPDGEGEVRPSISRPLLDSVFTSFD